MHISVLSDKIQELMLEIELLKKNFQISRPIERTMQFY